MFLFPSISLPRSLPLLESMKAGDSDHHYHYHHSFTDIIGELYLKEHLDQDPSVASSLFTLYPTSSLSSELSHDVHPTESSNDEESHAIRISGGDLEGTMGGFPPPISCTGKSCLQPIRQNGRFILTEMRISPEFLHTFRENGRLKVHVVHSDEGEGNVEVHLCMRAATMDVSS